MEEKRPRLNEQEYELILRLRGHPEIVSRINALMDVCDARGQAAHRRLDEVEKKLLDGLREFGRTELENWAGEIESQSRQQLKKQSPGVQCVKKKELSFLTIFGQVRVNDRVMKVPGKRGCVRPLPGKLGVKPQGRSRRVDRALSDFGSESPFRQAAERFKEHYGFAVPVSMVRQATLEVAARAEALHCGQYEKPCNILPEKGEKEIVAEADGTMICTVLTGPRRSKRPGEWKEMRLVAAAAAREHEGGKPKRCEGTLYAGGFIDTAEAGRRWGHCARGAGWALESQVNVVADGAPWIQTQAGEAFGKSHRFFCDFYHLEEHLSKAAAGAFDEGEAKRWRARQKKNLKAGRSGKVVAALEAIAEPEGTPDERAPARVAMRYMSNRPGCFEYKRAIDEGLPVGSGLMESAHRHVLQCRLKRAGTAWIAENANRIAQLRIMRSNSQRATLWN